MYNGELFVWNGTNYPTALQRLKRLIQKIFLFWGRLEKRLLEKALSVMYFIEK